MNASLWPVFLTDQAREHLDHLKKRNRKVWRAATELAESLGRDPFVGASLAPPFEDGSRRLHFWRDKYRLVWLVRLEDRSVDVLAVGLKTPNFYNRVLEGLGLI